MRNETRPLPGDIFTLGQLTACAKFSTGRHHSATAVAKALRRVGFRGHDVSVNQVTKNLWVIKRRDYWAKRKYSEWADHWLEMNPPPDAQARQTVLDALASAKKET